MCGAVLSFACLDATAKYLNGYMDTLQVVWARYTGAFLLTLFISNPVTRPGMMRTTRPFLQIGALGAAARLDRAEFFRVPLSAAR